MIALWVYLYIAVAEFSWGFMSALDTKDRMSSSTGVAVALLWPFTMPPLLGIEFGGWARRP